MEKYFNANAVFSLFCRDYMALKKDLPIRPSEMAVLNIISRDEELYTPVRVAEILGVSKPMIATHLSVLESKGYIKRKDSSSDKRSFYILLTNKGLKLVSDARKAMNTELKRIEDKIGKDKFALLVSLVEEVVDR